jgi:hypothetical protein
MKHQFRVDKENLKMNNIFIEKQEPEYSKSQLQHYKEKYKITDKDMQKIEFNFRVLFACDKK